jgi:RNA polymerase sigma factor (sigma-70 family)
LNPEEHRLVKACLKNDRQAQRQLYERYRLPLFRLCLRYARDRQEAEDFLHDGFLAIFRDLPQFRGSGALGGWLRRVMLNTALQHLRRQRPFSPLERLTEGELAGEDPADPDPELPEMEFLVEVIRQLPPGYRAVFNLFVVENYSHQAIAEALGISVGASKSQLHKAKAMLRERLSGVAITGYYKGP